MRRLSASKKTQLKVPKEIFVVCGNDFPLSATFNEVAAKREVQRLRDAEERAMRAAQRQKIGLANEIHYHVQTVKLLEE